VSTNRFFNNVGFLEGDGKGSLSLPKFFGAGGQPISATKGSFDSSRGEQIVVANTLSDSVSILFNITDEIKHVKVKYAPNKIDLGSISSGTTIEAKADLKGVINPEDADPASITLQGIPALQVSIAGNKLIAEFDLDDVLATSGAFEGVTEISPVLSGQTITGDPFTGTDNIKIKP